MIAKETLYGSANQRPTYYGPEPRLKDPDSGLIALFEFRMPALVSARAHLTVWVLRFASDLIHAKQTQKVPLPKLGVSYATNRISVSCISGVHILTNRYRLRANP